MHAGDRLVLGAKGIHQSATDGTDYLGGPADGSANYSETRRLLCQKASQPAMNRIQRTIVVAGCITAGEISQWIFARSVKLVWHEWHQVGGSHWLAMLALVGSVAMVTVFNWLMSFMVQV
jgi:hypothetical protein